MTILIVIGTLVFVAWTILGALFFYEVLKPTETTDFITTPRFVLAVLIGGPTPMIFLVSAAIKALWKMIIGHNAKQWIRAKFIRN